MDVRKPDLVENNLSVIHAHLSTLYGESAGAAAFDRLCALLRNHQLSNSLAGRISQDEAGLSERDAILITYGDQVNEPGDAPLKALAEICKEHLTGLISGIHILPFFPSSSDDGFAVIDYKSVDPKLGDWEDIKRLGENFQLMFDAVINHVSAQNPWFQAFLNNDPKHRDYFIVVDGEPDLSRVIRPRALPLLTRFDTSSGPRRVWTTFSADQIDLNYHNPDVLLEIIDILLFYAAHGARFMRLDAIAYLWKEMGTPCIHLPQTHRIIQLLRAVLGAAAPRVILITETNVPHSENISYFGNGYNEAQVVYNFALPPLILNAFYTGNARALSHWAADLKPPSNRTTFFNFLASHDGIGLNPVRGLLSNDEIDYLISRVIAHGGLISYKRNPDGTESPYELNINYFDALSNPSTAEPTNTRVDRFMTAQAIMLSLSGLPGIYFHSLFGSRGWPEGVEATGRNRTINRQMLDLAALKHELADPSSLRNQVFKRYARLLQARAASPAFHPRGGQRVIEFGEAIFTVKRTSVDSNEVVVCLHNVSGQAHSMEVDLEGVFGLGSAGNWAMDLISSSRVHISRRKPIHLAPYQTLWLAKTRR